MEAVLTRGAEIRGPMEKVRMWLYDSDRGEDMCHDLCETSDRIELSFRDHPVNLSLLHAEPIPLSGQTNGAVAARLLLAMHPKPYFGPCRVVAKSRVDAPGSESPAGVTLGFREGFVPMFPVRFPASSRAAMT